MWRGANAFVPSDVFIVPPRGSENSFISRITLYLRTPDSTWEFDSTFESDVPAEQIVEEVSDAVQEDSTWEDFLDAVPAHTLEELEAELEFRIGVCIVYGFSSLTA